MTPNTEPEGPRLTAAKIVEWRAEAMRVTIEDCHDDPNQNVYRVTQREIDAATRMLGDAVLRIDSLLSMRRGLIGAGELLHSERDQARAERDELHKAYTEAIDERDAAWRDQDDWRADRNRERERAEKAEKELAAAQEANASLEAKLAAAERERDEARAELDRVRQRETQGVALFDQIVAELRRDLADARTLAAGKQATGEGVAPKLVKLIEWALGQGDSDFPPRPVNAGSYWWRAELRRRLNEIVNGEALAAYGLRWPWRLRSERVPKRGTDSRGHVYEREMTPDEVEAVLAAREHAEVREASNIRGTMSETMQVPAKWTPDCQGKWDYDGRLVSISTRYWPQGGGFHLFADGDFVASADHPMTRGTPPSANCSILLHHGDPDDQDYTTIIEKGFEGATEAQVKADVEKWAAEQYQRVVKAIRAEFAP